jgi:thioredoxin reductase (NADPH)
MNSELLDLLVVGAGPTGIAIGAAATQANLKVLLVDRGPITAAILNFPTYMTFFTTRDKLEIANVPFAIPDEKPTRQQALAYYRAVVAHYKLNIATHEIVVEARKSGETFNVHTLRDGQPHHYRARAVAFATGYFDHPFKLAVPGADLPWVRHRYKESFPHFGEDVVIVGGGNSACEMALDLWRNGAASVTLVVRDSRLKEGVKYWVRPDVENRIAEGSIRAHFNSVATAFHDNPRGVEIRSSDGKTQTLKADSAYVMIGYSPDADLLRRSGVEVDAKTLVPRYDPATCESNVPGLYIAGTIQAGLDTGRIFIENSRDHGPRIVNHLKNTLNAAH